MKVLIACEESQEVCKAFRAKGHEAYSCDIQEPSGGHPEWHILGDALKAIKGGQIVTMDGVAHEIGKWDLLIAHPPCTYLSNAATRAYSLRVTPAEKVVARWAKRVEAAIFFMQFMLADVPKIAVENPVGIMNTAYRKADQIIHPYYFAESKTDAENYHTKRTCLWLKNLPPLERKNNFPPPEPVYVSNGKSTRKSAGVKAYATRPTVKGAGQKPEAKPHRALQRPCPNSGGEQMRYKPGAYIVSLDHLMEQELVYYGGKLLHKGWFGNWQLWYAKTELARLRIREAVRTEEEHENENEI